MKNEVYPIQPVDRSVVQHIFILFLPLLAVQLNRFPVQHIPAVTRRRVFTVKSAIRVLLSRRFQSRCTPGEKMICTRSNVKLSSPRSRCNYLES